MCRGLMTLSALKTKKNVNSKFCLYGYDVFVLVLQENRSLW